MPLLHHSLAGWGIAPLLVAHIGLGLGAGVLYFRSIRRSSVILAQGGRLGDAALIAAGRFVCLGCVLCLAAFEGAAPLLCMATGVLLARFAMLRLPPRRAA